MQNLSELFFDCVDAISSWNGKGALLKLKLKRVCESVLCPIQEQLPLDLEANCAPYNDSEGKDDSVLVIPREVFASEPQPPSEEDEDKLEPVQELTHFYTGTHDLQFGAHSGGAIAVTVPSVHATIRYPDTFACFRSSKSEAGCHQSFFFAYPLSSPFV